MGVPLFYKWLVDKYPRVVKSATESQDYTEGEENPNGVYDNLYLDMNCIIHPCFHPEDQICPPTTFDEVFESMFEYIDRLFHIVRPMKLLYMAVDGVAPRAKMNQQRSRRFKSARDAKDAEVEENLLRDNFKAEGKEVLPRETNEVSDNNVITPGTEFMEKLSEALEYYIRARLNSDPGWKEIKVILSDANVPGEGEQKIMSFIRAQRCLESYDPNTRHCLYGLDADLIILALASHEVHFSILREDVLKPNMQGNLILLTENFLTNEELARVKHRGWFPRTTEPSQKGRLPKKTYQFMNIWILREYLELEMKIPNPIFKTDFERLIDDIIFIFFLMGNDFLPHIPSLDLQEYAADLLIEVYKTTFNKMGGYIVNTEKVKDKHAAYLKISRLEKFVHELSVYEERIFAKRYELREKLQRKIVRQAVENVWRENICDNAEESTDASALMRKSVSAQCSIPACSSDKSDVTKNTLELRQNLKDVLRNKQNLFKNGAFNHDRVKLGSLGWKSRFYKENFGAETSHEVTRLQVDMVQKYLEGLCWVLNYYYAGVPSWSWYYPFHYVPFASDLKGLSRFKISFTIGKPLRPFDQLMAVLPPENSCALPKAYSKLMSCKDSAIQMFYPSEVEIDTDGKRFMWQAIVKLPFIDEELLLSATKNVEKDLEIHEMKRNTTRQEKVFLRNSNVLANNAAFMQTSDSLLKRYPIDSTISGIGGWLSCDDALVIHSPIKNMEDFTNDQTVSAMFFNPEETKQIRRLLDNVRAPEKIITEAEISKRALWHEYPGPKPPVMCNYNVQNLSASQIPFGSQVHGQCRGKNSRMQAQGWIGRGRGNAANAIGETCQRSNGRGHGDIAKDRGGFDNPATYSFRPPSVQAGEGGSFDKQGMPWRPVGTWTRGGGSGRGRGGGGQYRAW